VSPPISSCSTRNLIRALIGVTTAHDHKLVCDSVFLDHRFLVAKVRIYGTIGNALKPSCVSRRRIFFGASTMCFANALKAP
jgi:hypothetical protein